MKGIETPFLTRDPYWLTEAQWGVIFVVHGFTAIGLVGLIIAHVYFAILPEKRWMTKSMFRGWITKEKYLEHHDPKRWKVSSDHDPKPPEPAPAAEAPVPEQT